MTDFVIYNDNSIDLTIYTFYTQREKKMPFHHYYAP